VLTYLPSYAIIEPTRALRGSTGNHSIPGNNGTVACAGSQFGRRSIGGVYSCNYKNVPNFQVSQARVRVHDAPNLEGMYGLVELDTLADMACLGRNFRVIPQTDRVCEVSPYHPDYPPITDMPIVQAATAYDDLIVDDIPKHLAPGPNKVTHFIRTQDDDFRIPLLMHGVISAFHSRDPTSKELETCCWTVLTSKKEWNPNSNEFAEREEEWVQISNTIELPSPDHSIYAINSKMTDVKHSDLC